jgi:hypothetical protein
MWLSRVNKQAVRFQIILIKTGVSSNFAGNCRDNHTYEAEKLNLLFYVFIKIITF